MLVFVSDLHLTDGSSGQTIHAGAFRAFRERLRDLAYDASWRADSKYRPIESLDVVLLGDIFDVIRSTHWLGAAVRPWSDTQAPDFQGTIAAITRGIVENNQESLEILRSLGDGKTITVPPATSDGKPANVAREPDATDRVPVDVSIQYMVGNHDWFYHLKGPTYDSIRQSIVEAARLCNRLEAPLPHDACESERLQQLFAEHKVWARHGDIFDEFNYEGNRDSSSLGDAIVVELINRFPSDVYRRLGDQLPKECMKGLREIDNVRPYLVVPVWINGLLKRTCTPEQALMVKQIWDELVDGFLEIDFVRRHRSVSNLFGSVAKLEWALKFCRGVSLANLANLVTWIKGKLSVHDALFYPNAFNETAFKNKTARFIVYGHTHQHEIVPLDANVQDGRIIYQTYVNSGTWRAVHELAEWRPAEQEFFGYAVMTYLAFFRDDERKGRSFETWSGALGRSD